MQQSPSNTSILRDDEAEAPSRPLGSGDLMEAMPVREVLQGIGEVMQLPKRPTASAGVIAIVAPVRKRALPRQAKQLLLGVGALLSVLLLLTRTIAPSSDALPLEMLGLWGSRHPQYLNASMLITVDEIAIGTQASGAPMRYKIHHVKLRGDGDTIGVRMDYGSSPDDLQHMRATLIARPYRRIIFERPEGLTWEPR